MTIQKESLPPGAMYVLKTESLQLALSALNTSTQVAISFSKKQADSKQDRANLTRIGALHIIEMRFEPIGRYSIRERKGSQRGSTYLYEGPLVSAAIYAIPTDIWKESAFSQDHVCKALESHIRLLVDHRAIQNPWSFAVRYMVHEMILHCTSRFLPSSKPEETHEWMIKARA